MTWTLHYIILAQEQYLFTQSVSFGWVFGNTSTRRAASWPEQLCETGDGSQVSLQRQRKAGQHSLRLSLSVSWACWQGCTVHTLCSSARGQQQGCGGAPGSTICSSRAQASSVQGASALTHAAPRRSSSQTGRTCDIVSSRQSAATIVCQGSGGGGKMRGDGGVGVLNPVEQGVTGQGRGQLSTRRI